MVDQFLKGETMTVHQVETATTELQLHNLLLGLQLTGGCLYLVHHHGLPLEELVRHSWVLHQEEGGEEEEAQEGDADDPRPVSQPGSSSQRSDETRRLATGQDPELVLLLDPDLATFLTVFGPLVQHCPVANLLVSSDHWLSDPGWRGGGGQPLLPGWASSAPSSLRRTRPWRTSSSRGRQRWCTR